jgi:cell division protein FtsZ
MKATEMAISNPLIDDYTLKGAKGLLVNITGGDDLKLFEVDEVVNKIRAEVDSEAEVIIGAITDHALDGKIRVSIVATSLDGQQPEAKSVINMVHRIQNRNTGYSDFATNGSAQSFNFSTPVSHGANALKLENEITEQAESTNVSLDKINHLNNEYNEELLSTQETSIESIIENSEINDHEQSFSEEILNDIENSEQNTSNGLENFGVEEENVPDLFSSDQVSEESKDLLSKDDSEENSDGDDLEIPAFLRRQKN